MTRNAKGFSMIELLMVLAATSLMIACLHPALVYARTFARETVCGHSQHQVGVALLNYAGMSEDRFPALDQIGGAEGASMFNSERGRNWADVLTEQNYAAGPGDFDCPTVVGEVPAGKYRIAVGMSRYLVQSYGRYEDVTELDYVPASWADRGVLAENLGVAIAGIKSPSSKLMVADTASGLPYAALTATGGQGLIRHYNYSATYTFFDGHVAKITWEDFYGRRYDPNLQPTELASSTLLENLRAAGMVGGVNAKRYGEHYTSAETFSPWAPWEGGSYVGVVGGADTGGNNGVGGGSNDNDSDNGNDAGSGNNGNGNGNGNGGGNANGNNGHGNNVDGVDSSNPGNAPFDDSDPNVDDEAGHGGGGQGNGGGRGNNR